MKDKLNVRGLTLVEIIVSMLILGIALVAITSFFLSGTKISAFVNEQFNAQSDARLAMDQVLSDVRYATELNLLSVDEAEAEKASSNDNYIYIKDGKLHRSLYIDDTSRIETQLYGNYMDESIFKKAADDSIEIIFSSSSNNQEYSINSTIKLPNFSIGKTPSKVGGLSASKAIKYSISPPVSQPPPEDESQLVEKIEVVPSSNSLSVGEAINLTATVTPTNAYDKSVSWSSSNSSVATVSSGGQVKGESFGTATITATANDGSGVSGTASVSVTEVSVPLSLTPEPGTTVKKNGGTYTYVAGAAGGSPPYTYSIITIGSPGGTVTIEGNKITWKPPNGNNSMKYKVTVTDSKGNSVSKTVTVTTK